MNEQIEAIIDKIIAGQTYHFSALSISENISISSLAGDYKNDWQAQDALCEHMDSALLSGAVGTADAVKGEFRQFVAEKLEDAFWVYIDKEVSADVILNMLPDDFGAVL